MKPNGPSGVVQVSWRTGLPVPLKDIVLCYLQPGWLVTFFFLFFSLICFLNRLMVNMTYFSLVCETVGINLSWRSAFHPSILIFSSTVKKHVQ